MITRLKKLTFSLALAITSPLTGPAQAIEVSEKPVPLFAEDKDKKTVGAFTFKGGIELSSQDQTFGGLSGLVVSPDGKKLLAISDRGRALTAEISYSNNGELQSLNNEEYAALNDPNGDALRGGSYVDAESITPGPGGELLISFERRHRIWRYDPGSLAATPIPAPSELHRAPNNGGIEAMTMTATGKIFAIAEDLGDDTSTLGWISSRSGWSVLTYEVSDRYKPTGATTLPGGDILVLERRFNLRDGVMVRVRRINADSITPGAHVTGQVIAELKGGATVDNFEGIDAIPAPDGGVHVFLLSDDNFNEDQKTLLLMFRMTE